MGLLEHRSSAGRGVPWCCIMSAVAMAPHVPDRWVACLVIACAVACGRAATNDGTYHGRPIAQTCSYLGADWLERPDRAEREQPERVLDALQLDRASSAADVGAGTGYFTLRLARRVARVYATDLQPEMLERLQANVARAGLANVESILAGERDARLPPGCCDLVLLVDVYHELSDPAAVMAGIRAALTAHGRLVLIEYRGEDPAVAIKPEHKMTLPRIRAELTALGFTFVESLEFLPDQRVVIFTRAAP
jgi:SAM-dependent methyltransferase